MISFFKINDYVKFIEDCYKFTSSLNSKCEGIFDNCFIQINKDFEYDYFYLYIEESKSSEGISPEYGYVSKNEFLSILEKLFGWRISTDIGKGIDKLGISISNILDAYLEPTDEHIEHIMHLDINHAILKSKEICANYDTCWAETNNKVNNTIDLAKTKEITTHDGLTCKYYIFPNCNKPKIVLINAYGIGYNIWKHLIYSLSEQYEVITWESRGSSREAESVSLTCEDQAKDLRLILENENIDCANFICWCSGLKTYLEFNCETTIKTNRLVIITGYFEPFGNDVHRKTQFDNRIRGICDLILENNQLINVLQPAILKLFDFNFADYKANNKSFEFNASFISELLSSANDDVREFITEPFLDKSKLLNYAKLTINLQSTTTLQNLKKIKCPTLIIQADNDVISPLESPKIAKNFIHNCKLVELKNATHWCLWENDAEIFQLLNQHFKN